MQQPYLMLIICTSRARQAILDELDNWEGEGAAILLSGITKKAGDGFVFLRWSGPIPERFHQKMKEESNILDSIAFRTSVPPTTVPSTNGKS
jgi:hypothetical protein